jgi:hypothetical protein
MFIFLQMGHFCVCKQWTKLDQSVCHHLFRSHPNFCGRAVPLDLASLTKAATFLCGQFYNSLKNSFADEIFSCRFLKSTRLNMSHTVQGNSRLSEAKLTL